MSKIDKVIEHLEKHGEINGKQITWDYKLNYPSCVARTLRKKGYNIESVPVKGSNFVTYKLVEPQITMKF